MEDKISYYAVIPAEIRYDSRLKILSRLLYGEITALCNKFGFCWASNSYFANLYNTSQKTISRCMNELKDFGYISLELQYRNNSKEVEKRIIKLNNDPMDKIVHTYGQNLPDPMDKNVQDNNTSINNTINIKKEILKKERFVPPTLEEVEAYCKERKNKVDAKRFYDYYNAGNWKDGQGKPVKNWKQKMIATWEKNANKNGNKTAASKAMEKGWRLF